MVVFWMTIIAVLQAHPVTFKNGTAVTSIHRPNMTMTQLNYTIHRNVAVATTYVKMDSGSTTLSLPSVHFNTLLKRWNRIGSQANLYAMTGVGWNVLQEGSYVDSIHGVFGVQADFETPKIYTAFTSYTFPTLTKMSTLPYSARYRFGIAPYVAKYDELQIWVVGQVEHMSGAEGPPMVTPLLRYFYRTVLWETGVSLNGTYWFQMMAHF